MLKEKLKEDLKVAMKAGDAPRRMLISMVLAAIQNKELEKRTKLAKTVADTAQLEIESHLNDEETLDVIASEVKRRKDAAAEFNKGGRPELAENERKEAEMLMAYLPEQMSDDEIRVAVKQAIADIRSTGSGQAGAINIKDMGKVIGVVMPKVKGKADGGRVSQIVKEELSK